MSLFYQKGINHTWLILDMLIVFALNIAYIGGCAQFTAEHITGFTLQSLGTQLRIAALCSSGITLLLAMYLAFTFYKERKNTYTVDSNPGCVICIL